MRIHDIISVLEATAPAHLQESYDNAGLIVGNSDETLSGVLFCLDSTEAVIHEAVRKNCNLIVAHHPIIFKGLKRLNGQNYVERCVMEAIRRNVAIYAIHTNLDNVHQQGVNSKIAAKLGLKNTAVLAPRPGAPQTGAGLIGALENPLSEADFLAMLKTSMRTNCIRHTALTGQTITRVAVCGGAGSFLTPEARRQGAQAFVSADFKYHEFFDAEGDLLIADIGHYESEQFTIELLFELVSEKFPNFALHCAEVNTNPVYYHF